ncbi:hypothetical protein PR001_g7924 [Phytophthora rubi]|uniref:Uncharacterized protein n=1 Tax=Phytophthora rubi TaxID=129364 RepID=A0A6A3N9K5_9STRA|nr:hypothetical protein PR001_g7924 [Phytophthora rubi]
MPAPGSPTNGTPNLTPWPRYAGRRSGWSPVMGGGAWPDTHNCSEGTFCGKHTGRNKDGSNAQRTGSVQHETRGADDLDAGSSGSDIITRNIRDAPVGRNGVCLHLREHPSRATDTAEDGK